MQTSTIGANEFHLKEIDSLELDHYQHLLDEGFSNDHIEKMIQDGVRSMSAIESQKKGYGMKNQKGVWASAGSGLYFPDLKQLRLDQPLENEKGKKVKYLSLHGEVEKLKFSSDTKVITEGSKDAYAGTLIGGIPTAAIAGVSHIQKSIRADSGYTIIFDSDGWTNPKVIRQLINAGKHLDGKVTLVPRIPDQPKAGLCEFFKSGKTAQDYADLIKSAKHVDQFLEDFIDCLPLNIKLNDELIIQLLKAINQHYDNEEKARLHERMNRRIPGAVEGTRSKKNERQINQIGCDCTGSTFEVEVLKELFENEEWAVIAGHYRRYTGRGYWEVVSEPQVRQILTKWARNSYQTVTRKEGEERRYIYGNQHTIDSAFKFCQSSLYIDKPHNEHLRCFTNCTVDMRTGRTNEHRKDDYLVTLIPYSYIPNNDIPLKFKEFLVHSYGEDLIPVIRAITFMLLDQTAPYSKFIHLKGPSSSGKGTLLRLWSAMFGDQGYTTIDSFDQIATPEKRYQVLSNTSILGLPDISGFKSNLGAFYELVDNGPLTARPLHSSITYTCKWNVRVIACSVDHLQIENAGEGWKRRAIVIPTRERTKKLSNNLEIELEQELGQIIAWAVSMSREERDEVIRGKYLEIERLSQELEDAARSSDPVLSFADECLRPTKDEVKIQAEQIYSWFKSYCKSNGYSSMSKNKFISRLKNELKDFYIPRKSTSNRGTTINTPAHWDHLKLVNPRLYLTHMGEELISPELVLPGGLDEFKTFVRNRYQSGH